MFNKRVKIYVAFIAVLLFVSILRLAQIQLIKNSYYQEKITALKEQWWSHNQLKTVRGRILDRKQIMLAADAPRFTLNITYDLSSYLDDRIIQAKISKAQKNNNPSILQETSEKIQEKKKQLNQIIDKCAQLKGTTKDDIRNEIEKINDYIFKQRTFQAWRRRFPKSEIIKKYSSIISVPLSEAVKDFNEKIPDYQKRLEIIVDTDIAEMHRSRPLLQLKTDDDIFTAQLEFMNIDGVQVTAEANRTYPYYQAAAQTIGWVGPATQKEDLQLFENDKLSKYLSNELCGREDGTEFACETILRGRRGEEIFDIDRTLVDRTETQLGSDITLTIDINLQKRIEEYITNYNHQPYCGPGKGKAVALIHVATGDILALVSLPTYNLNNARYNYNRLVNDPTKPMINRAINKQYPPGSTLKPIILIAGLESGNITPDEVISCSSQRAPKGWPNCWVFNRFSYGHDNSWNNNGRNAIRGSCNIFFSRLADRLEPKTLQQWLFKFGYGHKIPLEPENITKNFPERTFRQTQGTISSSNPTTEISEPNHLPALTTSERRFFGIGEGNMRTTPLQVANAMATIARDGLFKYPRLILPQDENNPQGNPARPDFISLDISPTTLLVIRDGMRAVVTESGGTARSAFTNAGFEAQDVTVYGKTGSTQAPENAWFAGFAEDSAGNCVAIAVVVEGGQHGSSDASPLARDIFQFAIEAGYLGQTSTIQQ
ncbi:MAG: penicillin-binding transpeptidase domain-containing protein [Planctomycetota bacterium]|jgi:penicillin-binding protein 2